MGIYTPNVATLLYGAAGAGKTPLAVSSFWDWRAKKQIANGKLITFGAEDNPALAIPETCRQTDKGTSLRLTSPLLDDQVFLEQFNLITRKFIYDAQQGHPLDVLVIDGLSEFDLLFEATFKSDPTESGRENKFAKWNALLAQMFACMMRASPAALQCPVIFTARVAEKRDDDPGFVDYDSYPSLRGSFRLHLPHYFNLVLYMKTSVGRLKDGRIVPTHQTQMLRTGGAYVKNQFEHGWLTAGYPDHVTNTMWPTLWKMLTGAIESGNQVQEENEVEETK